MTITIGPTHGELAEVAWELLTERARFHTITQMVITAIGSAGPEDAEQAVARLLLRFNAVKSGWP
jgi:hypothetical protein